MLVAEFKNIRHVKTASWERNYEVNSKEQATVLSWCARQQLKDDGYMTHLNYFLRFNFVLAHTINSCV